MLLGEGELKGWTRFGMGSEGAAMLQQPPGCDAGAGWRCCVLCQARASSPGTAQAKGHPQVSLPGVFVRPKPKPSRGGLKLNTPKATGAFGVGEDGAEI